MRIAVTGSIATDHLMTFPGRFADQFVADQLHTVSLSFLVDNLDVRRGGVGANIAFGMGQLGTRPILVGAAGLRLRRVPGVARPPRRRHRLGPDLRGADTARFVCTTDSDHNQIGSFGYTGAMSEARLIELKSVADRVGGLDLVLIGADDPEAMLRHTEECRSRAIAFAADFSQQIARMNGDEIRILLDGATYLFSNEYEKGLIESKTGWSDEEILSKVGHRATTLGARGVRIERAGEDPIEVGCPDEEREDRTDGRRRRVPRRFPLRPRLGSLPGARRPGRLHARDAGHRDGRHPGVPAPPRPLHGPLHQGVRRRRGHRGPGPPGLITQVRAHLA